MKIYEIFMTQDSFSFEKNYFTEFVVNAFRPLPEGRLSASGIVFHNLLRIMQIAVIEIKAGPEVLNL